MDILETLRDLASKKCHSIKVTLVKPPTYVSVFYSPEEKPFQVILIYKETCRVVTDDVQSNQGDGTPGSTNYEFDLTGNPLEDPFEEIDDNLTIAHEKQPVKMWRECEESHLPLSLQEARTLINSLALQQKGNHIAGKPLDIWIVTKPNTVAGPEFELKKRKHDVLLALRHVKAIRDGKLCWFARSVVSFGNPCGLGSPGMDPSAMKKEHLKLCGANTNVKSKVMCTYHLSGELPIQEDGPLPCLSSGSVHIEVQWREPKLEPPLHEALSVMVVLGLSNSTVHPLWEQIWTLEKLLGMLGTSWKEMRTVERLPKYPSSGCAMNISVNRPACSDKISISEQLKTLFTGGFSSQNGSGFAGFAGSPRMSVIPNRTTMHKCADNSKEFKLKRSIQQVLNNTRINADATDDLWAILSGCESYTDLSNALDTVYREVKQGHWKPYLHHKNQSRTSALLKALSNAVYDGTPDLTIIDSSGILFALESLFELGLEKLARDYCYIFIESDLASRDELLSPAFPRKGLGVSHDSWLSNCDEYLTWLIKMHASLEVLLLTEEALTEIDQAFSSVTSQALTHFQSANTPIRSAKFLSSNERRLTFRASVDSHQIGRLLSKPFDLWQLTLTSESPTQIVETVFHRSAFPVFPPQILSGDSDAYIQENKKSSYCNYKSVTLMNRR